MVTSAKQNEVTALHDYFKESNSVVFVDYRGLKAVDMTELRRQLRESGVRFKVVKNTLAKLAINDTSFDNTADLLSGPVCVAFSSGEDAGAPARVLLDFAKKTGNLDLIGGALEGCVLDKAGVKQLADMPPKPVVQSMLLAVLQAPARNLIGVLGGVLRKPLYVMNAIADKKKEAENQG